MAAAQTVLGELEESFQGRNFTEIMELKHEWPVIDCIVRAIKHCIDNRDITLLKRVLQILEERGFKTPEGIAFLNKEIIISHTYGPRDQGLPRTMSAEQKVRAMRPQSALFYSIGKMREITESLHTFGFRPEFETSPDIERSYLKYHDYPEARDQVARLLPFLPNKGGRKSKKRRGLRRRRSRRN